MSEGIPKREDTAHYTRHGRATYSSYSEILASDNPRRAIDPEQQVLVDLSPEAREHATESAEGFFNTLSPERDSLFFVSSTQVRALETAAIYRDVAKERGFEVLNPGPIRNSAAQAIGGEDIRTLETLSLHSLDAFVDSVFNPDRTMPPINFGAIDEESKRKWEEAHRIVTEDDRGSWGANMFHHGERIKEIFPEVDTALELYETQFKNLLRLIEFGMKKAKESGHEKNVKILGFGHENYVGYALDQYFKEHAIANCETITFEEEPDGTLTMVRQGTRERIR